MNAVAGRILASRGMPGFESPLGARELGRASDDEIVDALLQCGSEADFRARLRALRLRAAYRPPSPHLTRGKRMAPRPGAGDRWRTSSRAAAIASARMAQAAARGKFPHPRRHRRTALAHGTERRCNPGAKEPQRAAGERSCARAGWPGGSGHEPQAEPVGEVGLADETGGHPFHDPHRVDGIELEAAAVVGQKQAGSDPCGPLVAVDEPVVPRKTECVGGREGRRIGGGVCRKVSRAGERRFDDAWIAHTARPAMLGELAFVDRETTSLSTHRQAADSPAVTSRAPAAPRDRCA